MVERFAMLKNIFVIAVTPDNARALDSKTLSSVCTQMDIPCIESKSLQDAIDKACKKAERSSIYVAGSLYLASDAYKLCVKGKYFVQNS